MIGEYFKELGRVYSFLGKKKLQYFISILITGLAYPCINIIFSFAYKGSINAIEFNKPSLFINICILFIAAIIIQCAIEPFANYYNGKLVNKTIYDIKNKAFKHTVDLPISYFEKNHSGDILLRLTSNIDSFEPIYRGSFRDIVQSIFFGVGAFISMMIFSYKLALCSLFFSIITFIVNKSFTKVMRSLGTQKQEQNSELVQYFVTTYNCGHTAKMFCKENILVNQFNFANRKLFKTAIQVIKKEILKNNLSSLVSNASSMFVLVLGLIMVMNNQLDIGSVAGVVSLQGGLTNMFVSLGGFFANMQGNLASVNRVFELLDTPVEQPRYDLRKSDISEKGDIISFEGVSFSYNSNEKVLDNLNMNIKENMKLTVIGHNGSGKSTFIKLLLGFYQPEGKISFYNKAFGDFTLSEIRDKIAYVSQQPVLFNASILENIGFGKPNATKDEIIHAAKMANIHDFIMSLEDGYETIVGENGIFLSGGQKQRITIARALLKDAPIILFDEATSSLDAENELDIMQSLDQILGKRTVIVVTHRLNSIQNSDWIFVLNDGQIVEQGDHNSLHRNNSIYKKLFDLQSINKDRASICYE